MKKLNRSPWGKVQQMGRIDNTGLEEFALYQVSTAGHGGVYVSKKLRAYMPNKNKAWYEEDCEIYAVLFYLYDFLDEKIKKNIEKEEAFNGVCYE